MEYFLDVSKKEKRRKRERKKKKTWTGDDKIEMSRRVVATYIMQVTPATEDGAHIVWGFQINMKSNM